MSRQIINALWNRKNLNDINANFEELYKEIVDPIENIALRIWDELKENNQITIEDSVELVSDLPTTDDKHTLRVVLSEQKVYQYNGKEWKVFSEVEIDPYKSIKKELEDLKVEVQNAARANFTLDANSSIPSKTLASGTNFKLVNKISSDELVVYQKSYNNSYLRYYLKRNNGGSGYGVDYELLRVQKVEPISNIMVYKDVSNPDEGVATSVWDYTGTNSVEARALPNRDFNREIRYSDSMNKSIQSYEIKPNTSVSYTMQPSMSNMMNVAMYARGGFTSSENFNLKIDDEILEEFNIRNAPMQYTRVYNFNVPPTKDSYKLTIENTSGNSIYLTGLNMYTLEEYKGQDINQFVAYGQLDTVDFIDNQGASDYAFKNLETNQLFGSYHGGEKVQSCKLEYVDMDNLIDGVKQIQFNALKVDEFYLTQSLSIKQESVLIERANVYSRFNFNDNGTLLFDVSYNIIEGKTPIPIKDFHTGLTCTNSAFSKIKYPIIKDFGSTYTGNAFYFDNTSGQVIQTTDLENQELHIRHTRYENDYVYSDTPFSIYDLELYRKYYYAPIRGNTDEKVAPTAFQFTKALDFYTI